MYCTGTVLTCDLIVCTRRRSTVAEGVPSTHRSLSTETEKHRGSVISKASQNPHVRQIQFLSSNKMQSALFLFFIFFSSLVFFFFFFLPFFPFLFVCAFYFFFLRSVHTVSLSVCLSLSLSLCVCLSVCLSLSLLLLLLLLFK